VDTACQPRRSSERRSKSFSRYRRTSETDLKRASARAPLIKKAKKIEMEREATGIDDDDDAAAAQ